MGVPDSLVDGGSGPRPGEYSTRVRIRAPRYHAPVVGSAYLRVFQPLEAFPERERLGWERFIVQGGHLRAGRPVYRERPTSFEGRMGLLTAEEDWAEVRFVDGRWYVCPWRTRLRVLASLLSLRESVPVEMADALVPETEARRVARELARIRRRDPTAVPTMLQSHWHVPVRWFVLFSGQERHIEEREEEGFRLHYWTSLPQARKRAARAIEILGSGDLGQVGEIVQELDGWLSRFDTRSAVELDYADLSHQFGWNELEEDHSAREIQEALDALEAGEPERAADLYQAVAARWAEARIRESLN